MSLARGPDRGRVALLLLATLLLSALGMGSARAASCKDPGSQCSLAAATAECNTAGAAAVAANPSVYDSHRCTTTYPPQPMGSQGQIRNKSTGVWSNFNWYPANGQANACATAPAITNKFVTGSETLCDQGCIYRQSSSGGINVCLGSGAQMYCGGDRWEATGQICTAGTTNGTFDPNKQTCVMLTGGFGECVKPDGTHCRTASTGKQLCWKPGETGEKATTDGTYAGDRQPAPQAPQVPPIENPTPGPETTTTVNNTTYNSGVWTGTGTGGKPGQPNTGVPGDSDGDGQGDGQGDGEDGGESDAPGDGVGDLYEGEDKTLEGIAGDFVDRVSDSELIGAAGDFLAADSLGGSCPTFSITMFGRAVALDFYCLPEFQQIFTWVGWLVLAGFSWYAFRWGFL